MELFSSKLKKPIIFQEKLRNPENKKFYIFYLLRENFSNINAREKSFLYFPL